MTWNLLFWQKTQLLTKKYFKKKRKICIERCYTFLRNPCCIGVVVSVSFDCDGSYSARWCARLVESAEDECVKLKIIIRFFATQKCETPSIDLRKMQLQLADFRHIMRLFFEKHYKFFAWGKTWASKKYIKKNPVYKTGF